MELGPTGLADDPFEAIFWQPIGRYIFNFGYLERDLDWALATLMAVDYQSHGQIVFSQIRSMTSKIKLIGAVAKRTTKDIKQLDRMDTIIDEIDSQRRFRNSLVHGAWNSFSLMGGGDPSRWHKLEISARLKLQSWSVSVPDLEENTGKVIRLGIDLLSLTQEIMRDRHLPFEPLPSLDKSPPPSDGMS